MGRCSFRILAFGGAAVLLAACSSAPRITTATAPTGAAPGQGTYKVGAPYQIEGTWYYPAEDWSYDETGIASWYGEQFHGRYTANGEIFDLNALTAAHRTLPMPAVVQVTNLENGRTIEVRVNDRGPYARGRIIDLSRRAAQLLGFEDKGTAKVRVKIDVGRSIQVASLAGRRGAEPALAALQPKAEPVAPVTAEALPPPPGVVASASPRPVLPAPPPALRVAEVVAEPPPLSETVTTVPVKPSQIYIQAGSFANVAYAVKLKTLLDRVGTTTVSDAKVNGIVFYRVRLGPVATVDQADALLDRIIAGAPEARIVVD